MKNQAVGWDEIPASPCMIMLGFHPSLRLQEGEGAVFFAMIEMPASTASNL
jgi:hypothetical protein